MKKSIFATVLVWPFSQITWRLLLILDGSLSHRLFCFTSLWGMHLAQLPVGGAPAWVSPTGVEHPVPVPASALPPGALQDQHFPQVQAIMWYGLKGIKPANQKLPWQPTWTLSQGSLVLLLKITLLFWIWTLLAPTPTYCYWNNCCLTWLLKTRGFVRFQQLGETEAVLVSWASVLLLTCSSPFG